MPEPVSNAGGRAAAPAVTAGAPRIDAPAAGTIRPQGPKVRAAEVGDPGAPIRAGPKRKSVLSRVLSLGWFGKGKAGPGARSSIPRTAFAPVAASLKSPVIRNRNMALQTLAAWERAHWTVDIEQALVEARQVEPVDEVRERIDRLLRGEQLE